MNTTTLILRRWSGTGLRRRQDKTTGFDGYAFFAAGLENLAHWDTSRLLSGQQAICSSDCFWLIRVLDSFYNSLTLDTNFRFEKVFLFFFFSCFTLVYTPSISFIWWLPRWRVLFELSMQTTSFFLPFMLFLKRTFWILFFNASGQ